MRGRKPKNTEKRGSAAISAAVTQLYTPEELGNNHQFLVEKAEKEARKRARKKAKALLPKGLDPEMKAEFLRVGALLAHPTLDRLKPHYLDAVLEYCTCTLRLRAYRQRMPTIAHEVYQPGQGRNGNLWKTNPLVPQMNETWRRWRSLVAILGLSPTDERNMAPGLGDTGDPTDHYFR